MDGKETCTVSISDVLKLNSFKQQACLRLTINSTLIANVKIRWKGLYLRCDQETLYFTRSVDLRVIDIKRCPHMGSCLGEKCAAINRSSLIPELAEGNKYRGRTGCMESCGGFGCNFFYLSSGCLFYRIFAMPKSPTVYEVFRCMRWTEEVILEVIVENVKENGTQKYNVQAIPNIPIEIASLQITMTMLTLPPTPKLNSEFITDDQGTAIWSGAITPSLR
ncbi:hypothetical protein ANCDUO_20354 [Ancylostoma duodenale]|uniref:Phlebovirus glycoprotein G2 fusion domain-containing protein n=1 Tax=Ancylostoma duodenale TaxID=51022 RepID=A0A0C2FXE6_9BILA|nr:hypothetical protein ANCDUO_20354 [Ancylostoma duodenale]